jgi:hypothetical protein
VALTSRFVVRLCLLFVTFGRRLTACVRPGGAHIGRRPLVPQDFAVGVLRGHWVSEVDARRDLSRSPLPGGHAVWSPGGPRRVLVILLFVIGCLRTATGCLRSGVKWVVTLVPSAGPGPKVLAAGGGSPFLERREVVGVGLPVTCVHFCRAAPRWARGSAPLDERP